MKLSCKVIEDVLPMYYDGVCSEESAALVEEHLKECPHCSHILSELRSDIVTPEKNVDDIKPLKKIQKRNSLDLQLTKLKKKSIKLLITMLTKNSVGTKINQNPSDAQ